MRPGVRPLFPTLLVLLALALGALTAADAAAQVGRPYTPLSVKTYPNIAEIGIYVGQSTIGEMDANGVTLFAASAPNGPILARIAYTGPLADPGSGNYV